MSAVPPPVPYDDELRERVRRNLAGHERRVLALDERRHAAVAVVLVDSDEGEDRVDPFEPDQAFMDMLPGGSQGLDGRMVDVSGGAAFLLCRRAAGLNRHASQWALPGGRLDAGESPVDAALRETDEELGVLLGEETVLGLMDDYPTRSGYVITPVVLWGGGRTELRPHAGEVLAAYRIGLHQLLREDSPRFIDIPESDRPVVQLPLGRDLIHAPTGGRARAVPLARVGGSRRRGRRLRAARLRLEVGGQRPVWPKPPPRSSPSRSSTTCHATSSTRCTTSWAIRSPRRTANGGGIGVEQDHLDLAAVGGVDQAGRVGEADAVPQRDPAAREHEAGVAGWDRDRDAGRHERPPAGGGDRRVLPGTEVEPASPAWA